MHGGFPGGGKQKQNNGPKRGEVDGPLTSREKGGVGAFGFLFYMGCLYVLRNVSPAQICLTYS